MVERTTGGDETEATRASNGDADASAVTEDGGRVSWAAAAAPVERRLEPGTVLAERYRIASRLGKGGMGEVYLADDLKLDQQVALKFLPPEVETDEYMLKLLFDEVKVARQISHANACRVFDLGEADGVHFLSMEYIDGEDLSSLLNRIGRLPWEKAVELGSQACEGLAAAHDAGILHRDLKPANLMIDGQGRAKITDFGLAALSGSISGAAVRSGTPAYMAPEQHAGTEVSVQSDIYALGLLLYELFTGHRAFEASSLTELTRMQEEAPKPPSERVDGIDSGVERIILRCLEKDPKARPASAQEVAAALVAGEGVVEGARIATLLLSDLVGSSALVERTGDTVSAELFEQHDRLARDLLEEHGGREIDKTDGFLLLFERPWRAVLYALDYHQALADLSESAGVELQSRVGIHLGEIVLRRNPPGDVARGAKPLEVEGIAKPTAARLMSVAGGRQTLMTQAAFDLARRSAIGSFEGAEKLQWLAHGSYLFKGVEEPVEVFEVGFEGVAPLAPPESSERVTRSADEDTILGWRPAPGLEIPRRSNWVLAEKLGEGGFGEVWLGEQKKSGEQRVFKFCYEAERLRSLQREITVFRLLKEELGLRDDIVRVLDWNLEEAPYFLEYVYVEGGSLVDWAESQGGIGELPMADRLEIVAQVATALAASHSVGVLHKDIKPANILMTRDAEDKPRAVVTDFGVGLVTDQERLAAKGITVLGLTEIDVASDGASTAGTQIYMAPELLAGKASTIQADIYALGVMLYQVVLGDFKRPLAQGWKRHVEDEILREDIAACVEGNPSRRPGNAAVVAERLRTLEERRQARKAEQEAVAADERAQRRRKALTTVAAVSSIFLVVVSFLAIQAMRARADAERRRGQAEQLIDFMLNDLHGGLEKIGRLDLLGEVARTSQAYFDTLSTRDESPDAVYKRGLTLGNIGDVLLDQGDADSALATQRSAVTLFEEAATREPDNYRWRLGLVLSHLRVGQVLGEQGDTAAAQDEFQHGLERAEELLARQPENLDLRFAVVQANYDLADLERQKGNIQAALDGFRKTVELAVELTEGSEAFRWRHWNLLLEAKISEANTLRFLEERAAAAEAYGEARLLADRLAHRDPANATWWRQLAGVHYQNGALQQALQDLPAALDSYESARAAYERLSQTDPSRVEWCVRLADSLRMKGLVYHLQGRSELSIEPNREAQTLLEGLVEDDPTRLSWLDTLARVHSVSGLAFSDLGDSTAALESWDMARVLRERVAAAAGDDPWPQNVLADTWIYIGDVQAQRNEQEEARRAWSRAVELVAPVAARSDVLTYGDTYARALLKLERLEEARPIVEDLLARGWDDPGFLETVGASGLRDLVK